MANNTTSSDASGNKIQKGLIGFIIGILLLTFVVKIFGGPADGPALYKAFFQKYNLQLSKEATDPNNRIYQAEKAYHEGRCEEALPVLQSFLRTQGNAIDKLGAASACCLLELDRTTEAITQLDQVIQKSFGAGKSQAQWYKALALLRQNDVDAAKAIVQQLSTDVYAPHQKQAQKLLKKL